MRCLPSLNVIVSPQSFCLFSPVGHPHFHEDKRWIDQLGKTDPLGHRPGTLEFRDILSITVGKDMIYRLSYDDGFAAAADAACLEGVTRTEYFRSEPEALNRARQLLEDGDHHSVSLCDGSGSVLAGIRLQLKLERSSAD